VGFRFEFDPVNKALLMRVDGRIEDESLAECYRAIRQYSTSTDASVAILDFSAVTEFAPSTAFVRMLAKQEPAMPDAFHRRRIIVAPAPVAFGLARLFQIVGESTRPLLEVVRTLDDALTALGIQSAHFEPLD
jgi:hypothetical protein